MAWSNKTPTLCIVLALFQPFAWAQDGVADGAPQSTEQVDGDDGDRQSYRSAIESYTGRLDEFRDEVQQIIDKKRVEERENLLKGFEVSEEQLREKARQRRELAVLRFEGFRKKYPDAEYTPHVLYRLAELYWEEAEESYLDAVEEMARLEELAQEDPEIEAPEDPMRDYAKPIALYKEIIERFPDYKYVDGALYMLGYCYGELENLQKDDALSEQALSRLVREYPDSPATIDASLRLGERYFTQADRARDAQRDLLLKAATDSFRRVVAAGPDDGQYDDGLYMLAWTHYRSGQPDKALKYFTELLDWDRKNFLESGKASKFSKEAKEYMALTFSEIAMDTEGHPLEIAKNWFDKKGARDWEHDVYVFLAERLEDYDRHLWAVQTLLMMQERWPLDPGNPVRQRHVAYLYATELPEKGSAAAARALADLADNYGEGTDWWEANRSNPDALAAARDFIQSSLANVARGMYTRAATRDKVEGRTAAVKMEYSEAADRFRAYLESDPFVSNQEENQWYLAISLSKAGRYKESIAEYVSLANKEGHPYREASRYEIMKGWKKILVNTYPTIEKAPKDAVRERVVTSANSGAERDVFQLGEAHTAFIEACDELRTTTFNSSAVNDPYIATLEEDRVALHYLPAQILYEHGRYEEARPRLTEVIDTYPDTEEAAFAANALVNTYVEEGDLETVRTLLTRFSTENFGSDPGKVAERRDEFRGQLETTVYDLAQRLQKSGKLLAAANAFLSFTEEFPEAELASKALYSSAVNYNGAGKKARANEIYEEFINRYPDDELSDGLTFDIAENAAEVLEFDKALDYYGRIIKYFAGSKNAKNALYNSANLKVGIGDARGAATDLEAYVRKFPDDAENESLVWLAGEQWELVSDKDALRFFQRYLSERQDVDPGHTLEALFWIANHYEEQGNRKAPEAWQELVTKCDAYLAEGRQPGPRGVHRAASVVLKELLKEVEAYKVINYPDSSKSTFMTKWNELTVSKEEQLAAIFEGAKSLREYKDPVTMMGSYYAQGEAQLAFAELFFNAPTPDGLNDRMTELFETRIAEMAQPIQNNSIASMEKVLELSAALKSNSEWVGKAIVTLNDLKPKKYPLEKPEARGAVDASYVPVPIADPSDEPLPAVEEE